MKDFVVNLINVWILNFILPDGAYMHDCIKKPSLSLIYIVNTFHLHCNTETRGIIDRLIIFFFTRYFQSPESNRGDSSRVFMKSPFLGVAHSSVFRECKYPREREKRDYKSPHGENFPRPRVTMLFGCSLFDDANVTEWRTCSCSRDCVRKCRAVPCCARAPCLRARSVSQRDEDSPVYGTRDLGN